MIAAASTTRRTAQEQVGDTWLPNLIVSVATLAVVVAITIVALDVPGGVFRSPDENSDYIFTRTLADTGKLSYEKDFLAGDLENLLHPRGAITHEGRAVPFNFLGLPVFYAPFYAVAGDDIRYIAVPIAVITIWALASAGALLTRDRPWIAWLATLAVTPLLYQFGRPLLNVAPAVMFLSLGGYFFLQYATGRRTDRGWLALAALSFALAAFMRYELTLFAGLLVVIGIAQRRRFAPGAMALDAAVYLIITLAAFVAPVLALNEYVYGSPTTYGYSLFNEAYFPGREGGGDSVSALLTRARGILLPAYPLDFELAARALVFQVGGVAPMFAIVAVMGLVALFRDRRLPDGFFIAYVALGVYTFAYRGAGESFLSDSTTPNLEASVTRYALPVYLAAYLLVVYAAALARRAELAAAVLLMLAITSILGLTTNIEGNLLHVRTQVRAGQELLETGLLARTETDSVIYTDVYDKVLSSERDVAAWWGGSEGTLTGFFRAEDVARSMARIIESRPVYLYVAEEEFVIPRLDAALAYYGLQTAPTEYQRLHAVVRPRGAPAGAR